MIEFILSGTQLACLKAAVTIGSEESSVLGRAMSFGSKLFSPEPFAVQPVTDLKLYRKDAKGFANAHAGDVGDVGSPLSPLRRSARRLSFAWVSIQAFAFTTA
jgi:hypothetical protein